MKGQYLFKQSSMGNHGIWVHPEEKGVNVNQSTALPHFYCLIYTSSNHIRCRLVEICEERKASVKSKSQTPVFSTLAEWRCLSKTITSAPRLHFKAHHVCSPEGKFSQTIISESMKTSCQFTYKGAFMAIKIKSKTSQTDIPSNYQKTELHGFM